MDIEVSQVDIRVGMCPAIRVNALLPLALDHVAEVLVPPATDDDVGLPAAGQVGHWRLTDDSVRMESPLLMLRQTRSLPL